MFMFALGAQKNRLTETYSLPMLWLDPNSYKKGSFYAHTFPATKGEFSGAEGEGVLSLLRIPYVLVMGGIGNE